MFKSGDRVNHQIYGSATVIDPRNLPLPLTNNIIGGGMLQLIDKEVVVVLLFDNGYSVDYSPYFLASPTTCSFIENEIGNSISSSIVPKNNDGLSDCFWCHVATEKRGGGRYDVCPKCGR